MLRYAFAAVIIKSAAKRKKVTVATEYGLVAPNAQTLRRIAKALQKKATECVWKDVHFWSNIVNQT